MYGLAYDGAEKISYAAVVVAAVAAVDVVVGRLIAVGFVDAADDGGGGFAFADDGLAMEHDDLYA